MTDKVEVQRLGMVRSGRWAVSRDHQVNGL